MVRAARRNRSATLSLGLTYDNPPRTGKPESTEAVFAQAGTHPCVLFFDEADSVLGKRLSQVTQAADHGVNMARSVLLTELDRYQGVVIFATNLPQNYDPAFARRIRHPVHFALPDAETRGRLFQAHLPRELPLDQCVSPRRLAEAAEGFSGGDIVNTVLLAAARAASGDRDDVTRTVTLAHFLEAMDQVRATRAAITGNTKPERPDAAAHWMEGKLEKSLRQQGNPAGHQEESQASDHESQPNNGRCRGE